MNKREIAATDEQWAAWKAIALNKRISLREWIRQTLDAELERETE